MNWRLLLSATSLLSLRVQAKPAVSKGALADLYTCAQEMAKLNYKQHPLGPIFSAGGGILFTSAGFASGLSKKTFIVMTPTQIYSTELQNVPIHNLTFHLNEKTYFVSYLFGDIMGNRYLNFAVNHTPTSKSFEDFRLVQLAAAPQLKSVLLGLLDDQLDQILREMSDGTVDRSRAKPDVYESCRKLNERSEISAQFQQNIDVLTLWTSQAPERGARMPASL